MKLLKLTAAATAILLSSSANAAMILTTLLPGVNDGINSDGSEQLDGIIGIDVTHLDRVDWIYDADGDPLNGNQLLNPQTSGGLTITGTVFKPEPDSTEAIAGTWSWDDSFGSLDFLTFKFDNWLAVYQITGGDTFGNWSALGACDDGLTAGLIDSAQHTSCTNNGNAFALSHSAGYSVVPVPAAVWLFGSGLLGLIGMARRKKA